jgi:hypothetical protein
MSWQRHHCTAPGPEIATVLAAWFAFVILDSNNADVIHLGLEDGIVMAVIDIKKNVAWHELVKVLFGHDDRIRLSNNGL